MLFGAWGKSGGGGGGQVWAMSLGKQTDITAARAAREHGWNC